MKRPPLDRTEPIRSWAKLFGASADGAPSSGSRPPRVEEAVSRSVELGYRIVDDYIQQGQRAAQRLSEGRLTADAVASEVQDVGARLARYASDFFGAWIELFDLAAAGSAARSQAATGDGAASEAPAAPRVASESGVQLSVTTTRRTEIRLHLRPERATGRLRAHALRSTDPKKPQLGRPAVRSDGASGIPVLSLRIPDNQPPGAYEGLLLDEATNRPVGSLRVVLAPSRRRSPKARE